MQKLIVISILILLCLACSESNDTAIYEEDYQDLRTILSEVSEDGTLDYFMLPSEDDYNEIPQDPLNPITADKVELGKNLFHDTGLSNNSKMSESLGQFSCASCHHAGSAFQSGIAQGIGEGGIDFGIEGEQRRFNPNYPKDSIDVQPIRTPTIINSAYQTNMLWNGQFGATGVNVGTESNWTPGTPKEFNNEGFEGVETQAIAGMGVHRLSIDEDIVRELGYLEMFDNVFSDYPVEERYTNITASLAMAAFERTVLSNQAPFQKWLRNETELDYNQMQGGILFFTKGECYKCHTGPALNSMNFHALGMDDLTSQSDIFIANSENVERLGRGGFTGEIEDMYKFKVPQLYNLENIRFLGHGASFNSVGDVIEYKNNARVENQVIPKSQLSPHFTPLGLSDREVEQLTIFVEQALNDPNITRYAPDHLPSGNCFPNADALSMNDLGCN